MKDITEIFQEVVSSEVAWSFSLFYDVMGALNNSGIEVSFWDGEENWASIVVGHKIKGYIWKAYPLIIFEKDIQPDIEMRLSDVENVSYLAVDSLSKNLFRIEGEFLHRYFSGFVDFSSFTIDDLWFNTNT